MKLCYSRFSPLVLCLGLLSFQQAWGQTLNLQIDSPAPNTCVPNNPALQPGGSPDQPGTFIPSSVPLSFRITEPNGDDVTLTATVNGIPTALTSSTVFTDGPGIETLVDYYAIEAEAISDGQGLVFTLTAESPAGTVSDTVTFDLDRTPPSLEFTPAQLALYAACDASAEQSMNTIMPIVSDDFDPSPTISSTDQSENCTVTRIFTVSDHCGEGNAQEVYFQINKPSPQPAEIYFSGAEDGEFYLETYSYFGTTDTSCFTTTGTISVDGNPPVEITTGSFFDTPGSYVLDVSASDCSGTTYSDTARFDLLEKPFAVTGGPYQGQQGQVLGLDGGDSFCPPELGGIIEYAWDFDLLDDGDGGYSHLGAQVDFVDQNGAPFDDGTYQVGLRITTQAGQVEYDSTEIVINDAPPVCDAGGPYEIEQGLFLTFDGSNSSPGTPSEPILAYRWHFGEFPGDLNEQFAPNLTAPEHFYMEEGEYTVTLTAYDIDSECSDQAQVIVRDVEPIVRGLRVVGDGPFVEGSLLQFSAGTTSAGSSAEPIIQFIWSWDDGTADTESLLGDELRNPSHRFMDSGSFDVCLTVDDSDSLVTGCIPVVIEDLRPIARLSGDLFAIEGEPAQFSIAGTRAGGTADPLSHALIDWGDGSAIQRIDDFTQTDLHHTFEANGNLTITMTLFDEEEDQPATTQLEIYVDDVSPRPVLSSPFIREDGVDVPSFAQEGLQLTWSASQSTAGAPSDPIVTYRWNWGDGSPVEEGPEAERSHVYADDGNYVIYLTAIDSDGSLSTISRLTNVANRAPFNANISTESDTVDFGVPVRFELSYEDVPSDFVTVSWRMGEGTQFGNQRVVVHTYRELGQFTVTIDLRDEDGGESTITYLIEVTPAGPRILVPNLEPVAEGELLSFELELRASEASNGSFDGPVDMRVLQSPQGMEFIALESANPTLSTRYRVEWRAGSGSAGLHPFKIMAQSPSGIIRYFEQNIEVIEAQEHILASLGGSVDHASLSLFKYQSNVSRESTELERFAFVNLGRGVGRLMSLRQDYFVTVPHSGHIAVIAENSGTLIRKIPVDGAPYALAEAMDYVWAFDARKAQVIAIDRRLKVYRKSIIGELSDAIIAAQGISTEEGPRLIVLSTQGELLLLDPEAYISNQPSRAILARAYLNDDPEQYQGDNSQKRTAVMGDILKTSEHGLIAHNGKAIYQLDMEALQQDELQFAWILRPQSTIRDLTIHQEALWTASEQGLRRFEWPQVGSGLTPDPETGYPRLKGTVIDLNQQSAILSFPESLFGEPILITANARQIKHMSSRSLRQVFITPDLNPQRLLVMTRDTRQ